MTGSTRSGTSCFITVTIWQQWASIKKLQTVLQLLQWFTQQERQSCSCDEVALRVIGVSFSEHHGLWWHRLLGCSRRRTEVRAAIIEERRPRVPWRVTAWQTGYTGRRGMTWARPARGAPLNAELGLRHSSNMPWLTVSNAAYKSRPIRTVTYLLSADVYTVPRTRRKSWD